MVSDRLWCEGSAPLRERDASEARPESGAPIRPYGLRPWLDTRANCWGQSPPSRWRFGGTTPDQW